VTAITSVKRSKDPAAMLGNWRYHSPLTGTEIAVLRAITAAIQADTRTFLIAMSTQ
jgi:hypothetical protein